MAITQSKLTSGSTTGGASWTTASVTLAANKLQILSVHFDVFGGGTLGTVSVSGFTEIGHVDFSSIASPGNRLVLLRRLSGSSSTGTLSITTSGGSSEKAAAWDLQEFDGIDTSGTNGSGAIVQYATNNTDGSGSPNAMTVTLAALGDASNNAVYVAFGSAETGSLSPGSGYSELTDVNDGAGQDVTLESQYKNPGTTTPNVSGASGFVDQGGIAIEIKAAAAGTTDAAFQDTATASATFTSETIVDAAASIQGSGVATFVGASTNDSDWQQTAVSVLTTEGASTNDSAWSETATGLAQFEGASTVSSAGDGDFSMAATAAANFEGAATTDSALTVPATASVNLEGASIAGAAASIIATGADRWASGARSATRYDGWKPRKKHHEQLLRDDEEFLKYIAAFLQRVSVRPAVRH